jgi:hypothetical protein
MNAYLLFLETWYFKSSGDKTGLRFVAYFQADGKLGEIHREMCENAPRTHDLRK